MRASRQRRYPSRPRQSTKALTAKLTMFAIIATVLMGGLIATQMAAGNDPALGPKAVARAKKASARNANTSSSAGTTSSSGTDPYAGSSDGYSSGTDSSGYSTDSSGYSSGSSGYAYTAPAPVTSSTS